MIFNVISGLFFWAVLQSLVQGCTLYRVVAQCCLAVWSRWVESSTRLGGFRALKKTLEAPYTTKVNNR